MLVEIYLTSSNFVTSTSILTKLSALQKIFPPKSTEIGMGEFFLLSFLIDLLVRRIGSFSVLLFQRCFLKSI